MTDQPSNAPAPDSAPTPPLTIEDIAALANAYVAGKTLKRVEVVAFMKGLLELLWTPAPVVVNVPDNPDQVRKMVAAVQSEHPTENAVVVDVDAADPIAPALVAVNRDFDALVKSTGDVEPAIAGGNSVYLPPTANQRYTVRGARTLAAKILDQAYRIERGAV